MTKLKYEDDEDVEDEELRAGHKGGGDGEDDEDVEDEGRVEELRAGHNVGVG